MINEVAYPYDFVDIDKFTAPLGIPFIGFS